MSVSYTHLDVYKRQSSHCSQKIPVSYCRYDVCRKTMMPDKQFKGFRASQQFQRWERQKAKVLQLWETWSSTGRRKYQEKRVITLIRELKL